VPLGSGEVVVTTSLGTMVKLNPLDALAVTASVTVTVKFDVPVAVGVPEMTPIAAMSDSPAGRAPETDHV
jgi:hypothetical protein